MIAIVFIIGFMVMVGILIITHTNRPPLYSDLAKAQITELIEMTKAAQQSAFKHRRANNIMLSTWREHYADTVIDSQYMETALVEIWAMFDKEDYHDAFADIITELSNK
jgi:hypothetical protein